MTTQTVNAYLGGPTRSRLFTATATDDSWTELVDDVASKSAGDVFKGVTVDRVSGNYAAGGAIIRIITEEGQSVRFAPLCLITEEENWPIKPYTFKGGERVEAFSVATPT